MPFQPCPGIASFQVIYGLLNQNVENVYHVDKGSAWSAADLRQVCLNIKDWEQISASNSRTSSCAFFKIEARDLSSENGAELTYTPAAPIPGADASGAMPGGATIAVKWDTGLAGRSFRGRVFHIGLSRDQVVGNEINSGTAAGLISSYNSLITEIANAVVGCHLVVLSRRHNNALRAAGIGTQVQNAVLTDLAVDSQRRRLENHNRHH